jgi:hypothetical protein
VRQKILTTAEKKAIQVFLTDGKSSTMVNMIRYRSKKFLPIFKEEIALLETFLEKAQTN